MLGIVGGMGVEAGIDFQKTMRLGGIDCPYRTDEGHADRVAYLMGNGESPVTSIANSVMRLIDQGADKVVMACNTAHTIYAELLDVLPVNYADYMVDMVSLATDVASKKKAMWLGTTVLAHNSSLVRKGGISLPSDSDQAIVQTAIWDAKKGIFSLSSDIRRIASKHTVVVAGCTEMPMILDRALVNYINPATVLADSLNQ